MESGGWSSRAEIDSTLPSAAARKLILATADAGIGAMRNWSRVTIWPVARDSIFTDPVRFPVGRSVMRSSVREAMELLVSGTVAMAHSPKPHI